MKKIVSLLLALTLCLGLFAGCGAEKPVATEAPATEAPAVEAPVAEESANPADKFENKELNIAVFQGGYGADYWNTMIAKFEAAYPGVKVNMNINPKIGEILRTQMVTGNVPDFLSLNDTEQSGLLMNMVKERQLLDITDVFDGPGLEGEGTLRDQMVPGMLESSHFAPYGDGKIYLAPFNYGPMALVYNKTLFEEKGWEVPETWDDFFALAEELEKEENYVEIDGVKQKRALMTYQGIYPTYLESVLFPSIASAGGVDAYTALAHYEEGSFNNPEVLKVLEQFKKIGTEGYLMDGTVALNHTQSQTDMMLGKALFIPNGVWMENEMADSPREEGFEFAMMAPPVFNEGDTRYCLSSYEQFSIPAGAKNPELAKEFLRFLYTEESVVEFAKASGSVYALKDASTMVKDVISSGVFNMFETMAPYTSMLADFQALPSGCKVVVYDEIFNNAITPIMSGEMEVAQWAENVETAYAEIRADMAAAE